MKFDGFELHALPFIDNAYCKECGNELIKVSNGLLSMVMFCLKCKNVYALKLVKVPRDKVNKKFLEQATEEAKEKNINA